MENVPRFLRLSLASVFSEYKRYWTEFSFLIMISRQQVFCHWQRTCTLASMPMKKHVGAESFVPAGATLLQLRETVQQCKGCELYRTATQAVMGEGPTAARVVLVGEQPGDREDLSGHPFVGPAGGLLNRALEDAGISRSDVYVTNAVKHFKFEERGKRRIHKKPSDGEVAACLPWLDAELALIRPDVIVCLGATAAHAVMGRTYELLKNRGQFFDHPMAASATATIHPSAILRSVDSTQRQADYEAFVKDLKAVRAKLARASKAS